MQKETISDQALIQKSVAGDEAAFSVLLKRYLKSVYNFIFQLVNDRAIIDDLVQETFLKVWRNLSRYDDQKPFKTWLFIIAKNTAYDYLKKKKAIPFSSLEDEEGDSPLQQITDEQLLPDELLQRKDVARFIEEKLKLLPDQYRVILLLHYKEDFSLQEITDILSEPYNTIKSRHLRALKKLKLIFEED